MCKVYFILGPKWVNKFNNYIDKQDLFEYLFTGFLSTKSHDFVPFEIPQKRPSF